MNKDRDIRFDLSGLGKQFNLDSYTLNSLTEQCVKNVTIHVYNVWAALAKKELKSTLPEYLGNLKIVDKGIFSKKIVLTGMLPEMIEGGASAFDMKEGFKKSKKIKHTIPVYNKKGEMIKKGGDWYLTIPFRVGTPGAVGQSGFSNIMGGEIYKIISEKQNFGRLTVNELPEENRSLGSRSAIYDEHKKVLFNEYKHKNSIFDGIIKQTGVYDKVEQNTYKTFRRVSENSDADSWIHKGFKAKRFSDKAVEKIDVQMLVENEVTKFLEKIL